MNNTPSPNQEREIFEKAIEIQSPEERLGFIKGACGNDDELRRRIEALVEAHEMTRPFLPGEPKHSPPGLEIREKPGDRIGPYKILQQIGEGGWGIVYMAEQETPVRRRVALKVIKLGMDTKSVVARFEAERQALAMMDHPNIAKVFDAGATESGRPFFVMELVRGVKITDYCNQHKLPSSERMALFAQVCQAVHHAHQKGIIHRDIKPSNILVTVNDGTAVPIVIDFGIAKATNQQQLTDKTLFTAFEQFIGTPAYMSPEQAQMTCMDLDTRSDIYSLGVLLYELLTGQTPFDAKTLVQAGFDEMRRIIREEEPALPSTSLRGLDPATLSTIAQERQVEPRKLIQALRGDLDRIVMKALDKDRKRRYDTAGAFALDVGRYLRDEPVSAVAPSFAYLSWKLIKRRRREMSFAGLLLAMGLAILAVQEQRKIAEINRVRAETEVWNERRDRQAAEKHAEMARLRAEEAETLGWIIAGLIVSKEDEAKAEQCAARLTARVLKREGSNEDHLLLARFLTRKARLFAPAIQTITAPSVDCWVDGRTFNHAVRGLGILVRPVVTASGKELKIPTAAYVTGAAGVIDLKLEGVLTTPGVWRFAGYLEVRLVDSHGVFGTWSGGERDGLDIIAGPLRVPLAPVEFTFLAQIPSDYPKEIANPEQARQIADDLNFIGGHFERRETGWCTGEITVRIPERAEEEWARPLPVALEIHFVKWNNQPLEHHFADFTNGRFKGMSSSLIGSTEARLGFSFKNPSPDLNQQDHHQLEIRIRSSKRAALAHNEVEKFLAFPEIRKIIPMILVQSPEDQ